MLDRLLPDGFVRMREAAVFIRMSLAKLVLKSVRVHGVELEPKLSSGLTQSCEVVRPVPRNVERNRRSCPNELIDRRAVVELLKDVSRLALSSKACEAGTARAHAP